jgi:outer membrane protein with beta-barrel domain
MLVYLSRVIVTVFLLQCALFAGIVAKIESASAGTPDKSGSNAEIFAITITPSSLPTGSYPEITGFVRNTSSPANGKNGFAKFDVTAVVTLPNGSQKSLLWHDVSFSADQRKSYNYGKNYDIRQPGTYKVVYYVHDSGRKHLYTSVSKTFTVSSPAATPQPAPPAESKKGTVTEPAARPVPQVQKTIATQLPGPSTFVHPAEIETGSERKFIGIGGFIDGINFSAGPSLIFWPLKNIAIQGTYGFGTFVSYEARVFYRVPLSQRLNPYFGAGFLHAERSATIIGVDTKIKGDSFTAFAGVELPLHNKIRAYIDLSGTPLKLEKDVTTTTKQATGVVKYSPVTVGAGIVFYLF